MRTRPIIELKWVNVADPADEPDWRQALVRRVREGNGWRERVLCVLPAKQQQHETQGA